MLQGGGVVVTEEGETPLWPECGLQFPCLVPLGETTKGHRGTEDNTAGHVMRSGHL